MFCEKCGSLLVPSGQGFKCSKCGKRASSSTVKLSEGKTLSIKDIGGVNVEVETMPKIKASCPKCSHNEAYYRLVQTRGADESPTTFFTCTKCSHKWREY